MAIGISPTVDFAFKLMLGSPEHSGVTIHFLNAILECEPLITEVEFLNPFQGKNYEEDKLSVLDILAVDTHGRRLNIEMQTSVTAELPQRLTFYNARSYVNQLTEGMLYTALRPSISICVLSNPLFRDRSELHLDFRLRDRAGLNFTDDLQIHLLQLTNLTVDRQNLEVASPTEQWAFFLRYAHTLSYEEICQLFPAPEFVEAAGVLEVINQSPEQNELYSSRLKYLLDEASRLDSVRRDGLKEGLREGLQKGRIELIQTLQRLLKLPESTMEELLAVEESRLAQISEELQQQLLHRN